MTIPEVNVPFLHDQVPAQCFAALATLDCWAFPSLSPFAAMCWISFSIFGLIKLHVLSHYLSRNGWPSRLDFVAWFLLWPGLDAGAFFRKRTVARPSGIEWSAAMAKTIFGFGMLMFVSPRLRLVNDLASGWAALFGIVFFLHFGTFHLAALFWRRLGRDVQPIMNAPILSTSVASFWSHRWNLAFRDYASRFLFVPLARATSSTVAVLIGYLFSGAVHELAISVPAGAGYGLPTLYFGIQGVAIVIERSVARRGVTLSGGLRGWVWTASVTGPAAFLLFHPPFIRRVVLPVVDYVARFVAYSEFR